jgi:hypothetical protein
MSGMAPTLRRSVISFFLNNAAIVPSFSKTPDELLTAKRPVEIGQGHDERLSH